MELDYLKDFLILADTKHYTEAAERLFISTSTLSRRIQAIEKSLGKPLFNRTSRRVELSEFGRQFYPYAEKFVFLQNEYTTKFLNDNAHKNRIVISSSCSLEPYNTRLLLRRFMEANPAITVESFPVSVDRQTEALEEGICDFLFTGVSQIRADKYEKLVVDQDDVVVLAPEGETIFAREEIALRELAGKKLAVVSALTMRDGIFMSRCREAGVIPEVVVTREENMIDYVGINGYILVALRKAIRTYPGNACLFARLNPGIQEQMALFYRKDTAPSVAAAHFLSFVHTALSELYPPK